MTDAPWEGLCAPFPEGVTSYSFRRHLRSHPFLKAVSTLLLWSDFWRQFINLINDSSNGYLLLRSPPSKGPWSSNLYPSPFTLYLQVAFKSMQAIHKWETRRDDSVTAFSVQNPVHKMARYQYELLKEKCPLEGKCMSQATAVCEQWLLRTSPPAFCESSCGHPRPVLRSHCSLSGPKIREKKKKTF